MDLTITPSDYVSILKKKYNTGFIVFDEKEAEEIANKYKQRDVHECPCNNDCPHKRPFSPLIYFCIEKYVSFNWDKFNIDDFKLNANLSMNDLLMEAKENGYARCVYKSSDSNAPWECKIIGEKKRYMLNHGPDILESIWFEKTATFSISHNGMGRKCEGKFMSFKDKKNNMPFPKIAVFYGRLNIDTNDDFSLIIGMIGPENARSKIISGSHETDIFIDGKVVNSMLTIDGITLFNKREKEVTYGYEY